MKLTEKKQRWVPHQEVQPQSGGPGVTRRVLAYNDGLMCVENTFEKGAVGALHSHPHTQITYVVSGVFPLHHRRRDPHRPGRGHHAQRRRRGPWMHLPGGRGASGYLHPHAGGFCVKSGLFKRFARRAERRAAFCVLGQTVAEAKKQRTICTKEGPK